MALLQRMPSLTNVQCWQWGGSSEATELLENHLVDRPGLERLCLEGYRTEFALESILAWPSPIFCSLRSLTLYPRYIGDLPQLFRRMPVLEMLKLKCDLEIIELPEILSYCPNLIELDCYFEAFFIAQNPFAADKLALKGQHYPKLRVLKLYYQCHASDGSDECTTDAGNFQSTATALPNIEALHLPLHISADDLFSVAAGRRMPKLYCCSFKAVEFAGASFISTKSPAPADVFPKLGQLNLGRTDLFTSLETGQAERPRVVQQLCTTCPYLHEITYDSMDDIQRAALAGLEHTMWKRERWPHPASVDELILQKTYDAALRNPAPWIEDE